MQKGETAPTFLRRPRGFSLDSLGRVNDHDFLLELGIGAGLPYLSHCLLRLEIGDSCLENQIWHYVEGHRVLLPEFYTLRKGVVKFFM